jgi:hypothetical protein
MNDAPNDFAPRPQQPHGGRQPEPARPSARHPAHTVHFSSRSDEWPTAAVARRLGSPLALANKRDYLPAVYTKSIVGGKLIHFRLSPELAWAHCANEGKAIDEKQVIKFLKSRRRSPSIIGAPL